MEDTDRPRCVQGADRKILDELGTLGLHPDEAPVWQSHRGALYESALATLERQGWVYPCTCSRADILRAMGDRGRARIRDAEVVYPGTCRPALATPVDRMKLTDAHALAGRSWRVRSNQSLDYLPKAADPGHWIQWQDRRLGPQCQDLAQAVGDFVLRRADGWWAYQLTVVVDDAEQRVSDVVRGEDLLDNTPRQQHLQSLLGLPTPRYLHVPLVRGPDGAKLSKQNGAQALDLSDPVERLREAALFLALSPRGDSIEQVLASATESWATRWLSRSR
jgi:glutamyl-Q tRNA(Asp) synthetase